MTVDEATSANALAAAFAVLAEFLSEHSLTAQLAKTESALAQTTATDAAEVVADHGLSAELLAAALSVRSTVGRLNDVIHAATIALVLPQILEPGERVAKRPSLGAGNDRSRPFDVETDRRIAEFKVAQWTGKDAMRKRHAFADVVHLALDDSARRAQFYVVGDLPMRFLRSSTSTGLGVLGRSSPRTRELFSERFDPDGTMSVAEFTAGPGRHIELVDLRDLVPELR